MSILLSLASVAGAVALGAMIPGPSFVMVARTAVASSRREGLAAAIGMGLGGALFATAALLGLRVVLTTVPVLYVVFKIAGGLYLAYIGVRMWLGARHPLTLDETAGAPPPSRRALMLGFATQVSNPKTALAYAGIFAALMPSAIPLPLAVVLVTVLFCVEAGWYTVVALLLSSRRPRAAYLRYQAALDRVAGTVMLALGAKLIWSARA